MYRILSWIKLLILWMYMFCCQTFCICFSSLYVHCSLMIDYQWGFFLSLHQQIFGFHSLPLKTCQWALAGWTKVDLLLNHRMVTTCPLRVWSAVGLQRHTYPIKWMGKCLVSGRRSALLKSPVLVFPSLFLFPPFAQSLPHSCCLATTQKCEGGRCDWKMMSSLCQVLDSDSIVR